MPEGLMTTASYSKGVSNEGTGLELSVPESFGLVTESFKGDSDLTIIQIQDAHSNYEAQQNIRNILEYLVQEEKFSFIGLEGSSVPLFPESFHFFPYPDINLKIADTLAQKGEFSGAELYALQIHEGLRTGKVLFEGIEDQEIYNKDYELLKKGLASLPEVAYFFEELNKNYNLEKSHTYNPKLFKWDQEVNAYRQKHSSLLTFISILQKQTNRNLNSDISHPLNQRDYPYLCRMLRVKEAEEQLDFEILKKETKNLIEIIQNKVSSKDERAKLINPLSHLTQYKKETLNIDDAFFESLYDASLKHNFDLTQYTQLRLFSQHLLLQNEVNAIDLFKEIDTLIQKNYESLLESEEERVLFSRITDSHLTHKLLNYEALLGDWKQIESDSSRFSPPVIARQGTEESWQSQPHVIARQVAKESWQSLNNLFKTALQFYQLAEQRNQALLQNTLSKMKKGKHEQGVLIAGGFHSQGLKQLLREKNISYAIVQPKIQKELDNKKYQASVLNNWKTIFDRSKAKSRLFTIAPEYFKDIPKEEVKRHIEEQLDAVINSLEQVLQREIELNPDLINNPEQLVQKIEGYLESHPHFRWAKLNVSYTPAYGEEPNQFGILFNIGLTNRSFNVPIQRHMLIAPKLSVQKNQIKVVGRSLGTATIERDEDGLDLAGFVTYMDLLRTETGEISEEWDARSVMTDPEEAQRRIRQYYADQVSFTGLGRAGDQLVASGGKRLDTLIERQSTETPFQAITELISNALDASSKEKRPIGRFGVGAFQVLSYVLDPKNEALDQGDQVIVNTQPEDSTEQAHKIIFFKGTDGAIRFRIEESKRLSNGSTVEVLWKKPRSSEFVAAMEEYVYSKFSLSMRMPIHFNDRLVNRLDGYAYLNGDQIQYASPNKRVNVSLSSNGIKVDDFGEGMSLEKITSQYLIPREGRGIEKQIPTDEAVAEEIAFFYKAPSGEIHEKTKMRVHLQVSGVLIQSFEVEGIGLPEEMVLQLPSLSRLNLARNQVEIDEVVERAIKIFSQKLVEKTPLHQYALINGFLTLVRHLDEKNRKVSTTRSLVDVAREIIQPWVKQQQKEVLILPNEEGFYELAVPRPAKHLDSSLVAGLHPSQIPGVTRLINGEEFEPGTFKAAFTLPFKPGSRKSYIALGEYLLINQDIYDKHRDWPVLLNLRLNFHISYGKKKASKGKFISLEERKRKAQDEEKALETSKKKNKVDFSIRDIKDDFEFTKRADVKTLRFLQDYMQENFSNKPEVLLFFISLQAWLNMFPPVLRDKINLISILRTFTLEKMSHWNRPHTTLLENAVSFLTRSENEFFFNVYVINLLNADPEITHWDDPELEQLSFLFLTFMLLPSFQYVDVDFIRKFYQKFKVLRQEGRVFDINDVKQWHNFFEGVSRAEPHLESKKSLMLFMERWLRLYSYDVDSPDRFLRLLNQRAPYPKATEGTERDSKRGVDQEIDYTKVVVSKQGSLVSTGVDQMIVALPNGTVAYVTKQGKIGVVDPYTQQVILEKRISSLNLDHLFVSKEGNLLGVFEVSPKLYGGRKVGLVYELDKESLKILYLNNPALIEGYDRHDKMVLLSNNRFAVFNQKEIHVLERDTGNLLSVIPLEGTGLEKENLDELNLFPYKDGKFVLMNHEGFVYVFDSVQAKLLKKFKLPGVTHTIEFFLLPEGNVLVPDWNSKEIVSINIEAEIYVPVKRSYGENFPYDFILLANGDILARNAEPKASGDFQFTTLYRFAQIKTKRVEDYNEVREIKHHDLDLEGRVLDVALFYDGSFVYLDDKTGVLTLFDGPLNEQTALSQYSASAVMALNGKGIAFLQGNTLMIADSIDKLREGRFHKQIQIEPLSSPTLMQLSETELIIYSDGEFKILIVDIVHGNIVTHREFGRDFRPIKIIANKGVMAAITNDLRNIHILKVIHPEGSEPTLVTDDKIDLSSFGLIVDIDFFPDGRIVVLDDNRQLLIIDPRTKKVQKRIKVPFEIHDLKALSDNKISVLISSDYSGSELKIFDIVSERIINSPLGFQSSGEMSGVHVFPNGDLFSTITAPPFALTFSFKEKRVPVGTVQVDRTGFQALSSGDDLAGFTPLSRNIIRFLKEEEVTFLESRAPEEDVVPEDWEQTAVVHDLEVARLNLIFDLFASDIKSEQMESTGLSPHQFMTMVLSAKDRGIEHYSSKITSAIAGQGNAWIREVIAQNPRDAIRKAKNARALEGSDTEIQVGNYLSGEDWITQVRDPVGMSLWTLMRYFFPLDQSDKVSLWSSGQAAGFFGQGLYTLFADYDEVHIRTSPQDPLDPGFGVIHDIYIRRDAEKGPVITNWNFYTGKFTGTEIKRIRKQANSDPILESIFVQETLSQSAAAITSPSERERRAEESLLGDVTISYQAKPIAEAMKLVSEVPIQVGGKPEILSLYRSQQGSYERVTVDDLYVKTPEQKEKRFIPEKVWKRLARSGAPQIKFPQSTPLNIPRNDYFGDYSVPILLLMIKATLRDFIEKGIEIPGYPEDYLFQDGTFTDLGTLERNQIAAKLNSGDYEEIDLDVLEEFVGNEKKFFTLLVQIDFSLSNGNVTRLQDIRRKVIREKKEALEELFFGIEPSYSFASRINAAESNVRIRAEAEIKGGLSKVEVGEKLRGVSPQVRQAWEALDLNILKVIGVEGAEIDYEYIEDVHLASMSQVWKRFRWNLYHALPQMRTLERLLGEDEFSLEKWQSWFLAHVDVDVHESQHADEPPGEHTHEQDENLERGFAQRMGLAIDTLLFDLAPPDKYVRTFYETHKITASSLGKRKIGPERPIVDKEDVSTLAVARLIIEDFKERLDRKNLKKKYRAIYSSLKSDYKGARNIDLYDYLAWTAKMEGTLNDEAVFLGVLTFDVHSDNTATLTRIGPDGIGKSEEYDLTDEFVWSKVTNVIDDHLELIENYLAVNAKSLGGITKDENGRVTHVDGVLIGRILSDLSFKYVFVHGDDYGRAYSEDFWRGFLAFIHERGYENALKYFDYVETLRDPALLHQEYYDFDKSWQRAEDDISIPRLRGGWEEGDLRFGMFFQRHTRSEQFYVQFKKVMEKRVLEQSNKPVVIDIIGPGAFEQPINVLILAMAVYQKLKIRLERIPLKINIYDKDPNVFNSFRRGEFVYPWVSQSRPSDGIEKRWEDVSRLLGIEEHQRQLQNYSISGGKNLGADAIPGDIGIIKQVLMGMFSPVEGSLDRLQLVRLRQDAPELEPWFDVFEYTTLEEQAQDDDADFAFFTGVHTSINSLLVEKFRKHMLRRVDDRSHIITNEPVLAEIVASSLGGTLALEKDESLNTGFNLNEGFLDQVRDYSEIFRGKILPLWIYQQDLFSVFNAMLAFWFPESFAAETTGGENKILSAYVEASREEDPVFQSYDVHYQGFSVSVKTSDYFNIEAEKLFLAKNPKAISYVLYYGTHAEALTIQSNMRKTSDKLRNRLGQRINLIPVVKGGEAVVLNSIFRGKDFSSLKEMAETHFEDLEEKVDQATIHSRTTIIASEEVLSLIGNILIQKLEAPTLEELAELGVNPDEFSQYALPHAHLLSLIEGNINNPLIHPLRKNLVYDPISDSFQFVVEGLPGRINNLRAVFANYQKLLESA